MNRNFVEMLSALSDARADYLVVGGWAVAAHGFPRFTGDCDIWIRTTPDNARRVFAALAAFGASLDALREEDLASPGIVFQIGLPPQRIDIITDLEGIDFDQAWPRRVHVSVGGIEVPMIGLDDLIANKRATGRPRDLIDIAELEAIRATDSPDDDPT